MQDGLVSTDWLAANLAAPDLRIVDASWHLPGENRDPMAEYHACHIPGAVFFDINEIADLESGLPHMLPPVEKFVSRVRNLGLGDGNRIVVYDAAGIFSAARVWWMFRFFGHEDVAVLDGGLPKWLAEERPVEDLPPAETARHYTARQNWLLVRDADQVAHACDSGSEQLVDARPADRFRGEAPEPREGLRLGHIPGACNLPFTQLLRENGTMLDAGTLRERFAEAGVDLARPVVTSCGSGVAAAVLLLGLHQIGHTANALYDGSWAEWGKSPDRPVER